MFIPSVKCVVVGDAQVGKTCMLMCYTSKSFRRDYIATTFDTFTASFMLDGQAVVIGLWDTCGRDDGGHDLLRPLSYRHTDVFVVCFSLIDANSLENVRKRWMPEIKAHCPHAPVILIGTKLDLRSGSSVRISHQEGQQVARDIGARVYLEISSLRQRRVTHVFEEAVRAAIGKKTRKKKNRTSCVGH